MWRLIWGHIVRKIKERDQVCRICDGASYGVPAGYGWRIETDWETRAEYCPVRPEWDVDHIKPVAEGGDDHPDNLRLLCRRCHKQVTKDWHGKRAAERRAAKPHTMALI